MDRANYHAAEARFREALAYNPADARATFDLAQSLEKLDELDKAVEEYQSCIKLKTDGGYTPRCQKKLESISSQANVSGRP